MLRAIQHIADDGLAWPILIGRPSVIEARIKRMCLRLKAGEHFEVCNIENDPRFKEYWTLYHSLLERTRRHPRQRQGRSCARAPR